MNIRETQEALASLITGMMDKGMIQPDAHLTVKANSRSYVYLTWRPAGSDGVFGTSESELFYFDGDDAEVGFAAAREWLENLPSAEEKAKADALALTAKAIEASRKAGLEPDFVGELEAMMKRLSENVITDQSAE